MLDQILPPGDAPPTKVQRRLFGKPPKPGTDFRAEAGKVATSLARAAYRRPPPPPNVPALEKQDQKTVANLTVRQRTELHRTDAVCVNCHKILDPIGFGLENFDAIGRWRDQDDTGGKIDAAGELPGGKHFTSPQELKAIIAAHQSELARNLTEKLLAYALCRQLEGYDEIVVDHLMATIAKDGYRMQTLVTEIVTSYPFMHLRTQELLTSSSHDKEPAN